MTADQGLGSSGSTANLGSILSSFFGPQEGAAIAAEMKAAREAAGAKKTKSTKPSTVRYPVVYTEAAARNLVIDQFNKLLKRNPTAAELKNYVPKLIKAQKDNPKVQTYTRTGDVATQTTTMGIKPDQWVEDKILTDKKLQGELANIGTVDPQVFKRQQDKAEYDALIKKAKGDPVKIANINATTSYGIDVKNIQDLFMSEANKAGAIVDEADLFNIAKEAYETNQDRNQFSLKNFFDSKMKFGGTRYTGEAGENYNDLLRTAAANGMDLAKTFGSQVPGWLQSINKGESIETFKKLIRDTAKIGMPDKVVKLLDQGIDLKSVYAPYQNIMESILELPSGSIDLNDPTLRSAITSQAEIPLYDFQRQLRKDPRWQYTNNAREEVASITQNILRDFGFQG